MAELNPLIHAPARLQVLTTLSAVSEAEFATLRTALDVSDSVLSKHISTLADAGYLRSRKGVRAGRRTTWIGLTGDGREALREHVAALHHLQPGIRPEWVEWAARLLDSHLRVLRPGHLEADEPSCAEFRPAL